MQRSLPDEVFFQVNLKVLHFILEQVLKKEIVCFFSRAQLCFNASQGGGRVSQLVLSEVRLVCWKILSVNGAIGPFF